MAQDGIEALDERSRNIFKQIVESYVATGEPIGSLTISRQLGVSLSPATIRNVMADLEEAGLLFSPHTSAGRLPTDLGLRIFVDGLLAVGGDLSEDERASIDGMREFRTDVSDVLEEASTTLSGLSACAGLVVTPSRDAPLRHIEFVPLSDNRALVVLVTDGEQVENRVIDLPPGLPFSALQQATNYLGSRMVGKTLEEARFRIAAEIEQQRTELDALSTKVVEAGLALWSGEAQSGGTLILKGQSRLLSDVTALDDLERIRSLFEMLERKETMLRLFDSTGSAEGVRIFIGSESDLFTHTGCSMIIAPYRDTSRRVVGAIGVIGPTRMNYAKIIPMVDYTSRLLGRLLG